MKAYIIDNYGTPTEVLQLCNVKKPVPGKNEVLIRVRATSINDYDWSITTGKPKAYRLIFGLYKPRKKMRIPGMEASGIVEQIGEKVTKFKIGDAVYGDLSEFGFGSFAEFVCINEKALTHMPENMSFEIATSIPHAAMLALQALRDVGQIKNGQDILINGGGGGVGFFGIQIARLYDTRITGVDTGKKLQAMKDHGYDLVIDYKKEDFTENTRRYDLILDCRTNRPLWKFLRVLKPHGRYVSIGGKPGCYLQMLYMNPLLKLFSNKRMVLLMLKANNDLQYLNKLIAEEGKLKSVIDGPYPFEKIPWAVQRFGDAMHTGKIVITMEESI